MDRDPCVFEILGVCVDWKCSVCQNYIANNSMDGIRIRKEYHQEKSALIQILNTQYQNIYFNRRK